MNIRVGEGWDTHADNAAAVKRLCGTLDPAWSTLMTDLRERGLLASRKEANKVFYRIEDPRITKLIGMMREVFCGD